MDGIKEQKERLLAKLVMVINEDVLNEMDILMILQVCSDACNRQMAELYENVLTETILCGSDEEQSGTDEWETGESTL